MAAAGRSGTITDAIVHVLRAAGRPMTTAEILQDIETKGLYTLRAKSPAAMVGAQLRRHTQGANPKIVAKVILFRCLPDGKYHLLDTAVPPEI